MLLTMLLGVLSMSCSDIGDDLVTLEGPVILSVREVHLLYGRKSEPTVVLDLQTEALYPCCNYSIVAHLTSGQRAIEATILGISEPELCLTAIGPALLREPLSVAPGTYTLVIAHGTRRDSYRLEVTDTFIRLDPGTGGMTRVPSTLTLRFPPNSFAVVCGTMPATSWMGKALCDSLLKIPGITRHVLPDSGESPWPRFASGHYFNDSTRCFRYATAAGFDSAGACLKRFTHQVIAGQQGISIYLQSWQNEWYMSWQLANKPYAGQGVAP
jgi:hypothetical protein